MLRRLRTAAFGTPAPLKTGTKVFASHAEALALCGGYEESDLLDVIAAKTQIFRDRAEQHAAVVSESDLHSLLALTTSAMATEATSVRVLDFGGACGAHYYNLRRLMPRHELRWAIVETPGMAERANGLAAGNSWPSAFSSVADATRALGGSVDLVHASGALQCTPDPQAALATLLEVRAPVLLLTRGAVTRGDRDVVAILESSLAANGPGPLPPHFQDRPLSFPFVFVSRERLLARLHAAYRRIVLLPDHTGHFPIDQEPVEGFAALCTEPC